jgi:(2R)-ethylmalonyl-CoA mutase
VVLSKDARARAVQLPAWNEALGLPRPWDQQWSLRLQQIVALETDLLDYGDIFTGSSEIEAKVVELADEARTELARIDDMGGAVAAVESGYMKMNLVESNARRLRAIEAGEQVVVGVNAFAESAESPLTAGDGESFLAIDAGAEAAQIESLRAWRAARDESVVKAALGDLEASARTEKNVMPASIACAKAGVTTGEWSDSLRRVFGEYRAPTGIAAGVAVPAAGGELEVVRASVGRVAESLGGPPKIIIAKPGLDGHSNGAEQIAVRARDCGFEVVYEGIRLTPEQIVTTALEESVHLVGLSILSGSHNALVADVVAGLERQGLGDIPVVVGGIIPPSDAAHLQANGVARVYTPKDYAVTRIMADIADLIAERAGLAA